MAAYAALVSLTHIVDQIQQHPRPPISLDKQQVQSLIEKVTFLQEFLNDYPHVAGYRKEPDALESRIGDAAYAAEDVIESHIVDQSHAGSTSHGEKISPVDFYEGLQKVIEEMDSIKKEVIKIKEKPEVKDQLHSNSTPVAVPLRSSSTGQYNTMVGCDDVLYEILDKLIGGELDRQIIPIVGMGGIGKTTLARNIYQNQVAMQHFDILVWVTISQGYKMREILLELLQEGWGDLSQNECDLGDKLHKRLSKRRYLIIMDDIWDVKVWEQLQLFFPDNKNGSRIMLTTRLSNLASHVAGSRFIDMAFLDKDNSWNLFCKTVFGEEGCPLELEEIGKMIVQNCKGLPLSIVVIGGLLAKSEHTHQYWVYIAENLNSTVNLDDNERCLKILYMSYKQLPVCLKSCFLYMGVFKEDRATRVAVLIRLWVAEGFLKPTSGKSLEEIAEEYLKELINRNLILVHELGSTGNLKYCNIHDLLRDLCMIEAQKEKFYNVIGHRSLNLPRGINTQRRIVILDQEHLSDDNIVGATLLRSSICGGNGNTNPLLFNFRLLRILHSDNHASWPGKKQSSLKKLKLVNTRYLAINVNLKKGSLFPSSFYLLWNLHTLIVMNFQGMLTAAAEIWNMSQLKHVEFSRGLYLPDPPNSDGRDDIVLWNLQTLSTIINLKFDEEVIKRIHNIKKLRITYTRGVKESSHYYLNNLDRLHKLESFFYRFDISKADFVHNLTFPYSLKKLALSIDDIHWEDMLEKIGSLPLLEKLNLIGGSFKGREWETIEGQFCKLKSLSISACRDLEYWTTESSHFPCLEQLTLIELEELNAIPSEIGEIPTLKSIYLRDCSDSAVKSAKMIQEEQEESQGEVDIQVQVVLSSWEKNEVVDRLASPNFQVEYTFKWNIDDN